MKDNGNGSENVNRIKVETGEIADSNLRLSF